jgi:catechol 2,3-dioxygenase-like lactoylglutathione lyase family enzyme
VAVARLVMVSLDAKDLERTYRFYAAFGAAPRRKSLPSGDRRLLVEAGGVLLEFREGDRYGKEPWVTVEFQVDSVYHCFVALQQEGYNPFGTARSHDDSTYAWMMWMDPDGHIVRLAAREQDAATGTSERVGE